MRTIRGAHNVTPFQIGKNNLQLFRVIGSTHIDGQGVQHEVSDVDPFIFLDDALVD